MYNFFRTNVKAFAVLIIAAVFIVVGAYRGEIGTVMTKAIAICLECIGIG